MSNIPWERLEQLPTLEQRNDRYIRRVMQLCHGDVTAAAFVLKERERVQEARRMEARYGSR